MALLRNHDINYILKRKKTFSSTTARKGVSYNVWRYSHTVRVVIALDEKPDFVINDFYEKESAIGTAYEWKSRPFTGSS